MFAYFGGIFHEKVLGARLFKQERFFSTIWSSKPAWFRLGHHINFFKSSRLETSLTGHFCNFAGILGGILTDVCCRYVSVLAF